MSQRRSWNWREALTNDERKLVEKYDRAVAQVEAARQRADKYRLTFVRIQNRALHRAKYRALNQAKEQAP